MAYIYTNPYKQPYLAAQQELEQRKQELATIQQRITRLEATIAALGPLAETEVVPTQPSGIGDLCCQVLAERPGQPTTVPAVIHTLRVRGVKLEYANPSAVIHTTLKRISEHPNSPVRPAAVLGKATAYMWDPAVPPPTRPLNLG